MNRAARPPTMRQAKRRTAVGRPTAQFLNHLGDPRSSLQRKLQTDLSPSRSGWA